MERPKFVEVVCFSFVITGDGDVDDGAGGDTRRKEDGGELDEVSTFADENL